MSAKQAASVWAACQKRGYNAVARRITYGQLNGEHVVEIEPGHDLENEDFEWLFGLILERNIVMSYGKSPRRVVTLS